MKSRSAISPPAPLRLPRQAGYDGVEVMGSKAYFTEPVSCHPHQQARGRIGRVIQDRMKLPVEVVPLPRARGPWALTLHRSILPSVDDRTSCPKRIGHSMRRPSLQGRLRPQGRSSIPGIPAWNERGSDDPGPSVPRAAFAMVTKKLMGQRGHPAHHLQPASTPPKVAEEFVVTACADMRVDGASHAGRCSISSPRQRQAIRPDRTIVSPAIRLVWTIPLAQNLYLSGQPACLLMKTEDCASIPRDAVKSIAVVGAGPAGLSAAITAAGAATRSRYL